jgi:hypothetical protein
MTITLNIDDSWAAHPGPLSRILAHVAALEGPAPWTPPAAREPGQDDAEDLGQLLDGIDAPEPAPAAKPAVSKPSAPATPPAAKRLDGIPTTGKSLYRWACDRKSLPKVNAIGKGHSYPKLVSDWSDEQVATAYRELTSQPVANGQPH